MTGTGGRSSDLREEVLGLVAGIPEGRFTTYGSLAACFGVNPRRVASFLARLDPEESERLPWYRVVAAEGRISRGMDPDLREEQARRLRSEGVSVDARGHIADPDRHFHVVGPPRRERPAR